MTKLSATSYFSSCHENSVYGGHWLVENTSEVLGEKCDPGAQASVIAELSEKRMN